MLPAIDGISLTDWWPLRGLLLHATVVTIVLILRYARRIGSIVLATVLLAALVLADLATAANAYKGTYPTIGAWLAGEPAVVEDVLRDPDPPDPVVRVSIPPTASAFEAREAVVVLPPAYLDGKRPGLPVIVLLHGAPGAPQDWVSSGRADRVVADFAGRNGGVAPILVIPDVTGVRGDAPGCVDSPAGNVETYLTVDVARFVQTAYATTPPGQGWAVAGYGSGGACAVVLALRNPTLFATFGDFGGLAGPRAGATNADDGTTLDQLFGGDPVKFAAHEPTTLLTTTVYTGLGGWFQVGVLDPEPLAAARALVPQAVAEGIDTCLVEQPGVGPVPEMWSAAFESSLPWMVARLNGLPGADLKQPCLVRAP